MVICKNDILSGSLYHNRMYRQSARFAIQDSCLTKIMLKIMYINSTQYKKCLVEILSGAQERDEDIIIRVTRNE
jgi:hypothetical protein